MRKISKDLIYFENENDLLDNIKEEDREDFVAKKWNYCSTTFTEDPIHLSWLEWWKFPCVLKLYIDDDDDSYGVDYNITKYIKRASDDIAELEKEKVMLENIVDTLKEIENEREV